VIVIVIVIVRWRVGIDRGADGPDRLERLAPWGLEGLDLLPEAVAGTQLGRRVGSDGELVAAAAAVLGVICAAGIAEARLAATGADVARHEAVVSLGLDLQVEVYECLLPNVSASAMVAYRAAERRSVLDQEAFGLVDESAHPDGQRSGSIQNVAGSEVEPAPVARADDDRTVELAFGQRALSMRARVIEGVQVSVDVGQGDRRPFDVEDDDVSAGVWRRGHDAEADRIQARAYLAHR